MKKLLLLGVAIFISSYSFAQNTKNPPAYNISKLVNGNMEEVTEKLKASLKEFKFGVVTEINMHNTFKEKLGVEIAPYRILGICNVKFAHKLYSIDNNVGVLLPCKVLLKQVSVANIEVVFVDPQKVLSTMENEKVNDIGREVREIFSMVLKTL